jgi:hypothetical protein
MGSGETHQHMTRTEEKEGKHNQREQKGGGGGSAGFDQDRKKGKRKRGERMRVGHTARSNHSSHDFPHTEVRVRRAAISKKKKGQRRWEAKLGLRKEKKMDVRGLLSFLCLSLLISHEI